MDKPQEVLLLHQQILSNARALYAYDHSALSIITTSYNLPYAKNPDKQHYQAVLVAHDDANSCFTVGRLATAENVAAALRKLLVATQRELGQKAIVPGAKVMKEGPGRGANLWGGESGT